MMKKSDPEKQEKKSAQTKKGKRSRGRRIFRALLCAAVLCCAASFYVSAEWITVDRYSYDSEKITAPVTIVSLTDIHNHHFGADGERLAAVVDKMEPDLICIVGDALNYDAGSDRFLTDLTDRLMRIAPVYYTPGNHEMNLLANRKEIPLVEDIKQAGGVYLDQSYVDEVVNGQDIRIGGLYDYAFNYAGVSEEQYRMKESYLFLKNFDDTEAFKLLLSHQPESFLGGGGLMEWTVDLILSGHEHGGQFRLPLIGAVYTPHMGGVWFPDFVDGCREVGGMPMIISRGLGTNIELKRPPRFGNPPEVILVELK